MGALACPAGVGVLGVREPVTASANSTTADANLKSLVGLVVYALAPTGTTTSVLVLSPGSL